MSNSRTVFLLLLLSFINFSCYKVVSTRVIKGLSENAVIPFRKSSPVLSYFSIKKQLKISCEGTSLTYGLQEDGKVLPINNATQSRASYQYPSTLYQNLKLIYKNLEVVNRGFPGDRTKEGLLRWNTSEPADIVIIEYGTNDAYNFQSYPDGAIPVAEFRSNLVALAKVRLNQGSKVVICLSPYLSDPSSVSKLNPYRDAAKQVASELNLLFFDVDSAINGLGYYWSDGVHLKPEAYKLWGQKLANVLSRGY